MLFAGDVKRTHACGADPKQIFFRGRIFFYGHEDPGQTDRGTNRSNKQRIYFR